MLSLYEIYTVNPVTGERGWDIEFIVALNRKDAETYPNFDCVVLREGAFSDTIAAMQSGYPMTEAAKSLCGM